MKSKRQSLKSLFNWIFIVTLYRFFNLFSKSLFFTKTTSFCLDFYLLTRFKIMYKTIHYMKSHTKIDKISFIEELRKDFNQFLWNIIVIFIDKFALLSQNCPE